MKAVLLAAVLCAAPTAVFAQDASTTPIKAVAAGSATSLPSNTKVYMTVDEEITSKRHKEGTMFHLTVSNDVMLDRNIVIPRGTPAVGEVTWRTGRAMFGKSGKMDVELRYIELQGRRIPLTGGKYRQEGEGNTTMAVGAVVLAAPLMFVTGKSAKIPQGRELVAYTRDPITVEVPSVTAAPVAVAPVVTQ